MSKFLLSATLLLCLTSPILAANQADAVNPVLREAFSFGKNLFEGVNSFGYTFLQGSEESGDFVKTVWKENGDKYFFEYLNQNQTGGGVPFHITLAYDGLRGYRLSENGGRMWVKKGPFDTFNSFVSPFTPLFPFSFMRRAGKRFDLDSVTSPAQIAETLRHTTLQPGIREIDGHKCLTVRVANAYSPDAKDPVDYVVYLAEDLGNFPIAWEIYDHQGKFIYSYIVTELKSLPLPKPAKGAFRYPESAIISNDPVQARNSGPGIRRVKFSDVTVNAFEDEDFALDPSIADIVEDVDTETLIEIPR